jgi:delta 1-pyrroline-5-carboxylate dehydrogenase
MSYTIINPATGDEMETVEHVTVDETDDAIARAGQAQRKWAALAPAERAEALRAFARTVEADIFRQLHRQIFFRHGHYSAFLTMNKWDRLTPITLTRENPIF